MADSLQDVRDNHGVRSLLESPHPPSPNSGPTWWVLTKGGGHAPEEPLVLEATPMARPGARGPVLPAVTPRPGAWDTNFDVVDHPREAAKPLAAIVGAKRHAQRVVAARMVSVQPAATYTGHASHAAARKPRSASAVRMAAWAGYAMGVRAPARRSPRRRRRSKSAGTKHGSASGGPGKPSRMGLDSLLMKRLFGRSTGDEGAPTATVDQVIELLSKRHFFDERVSAEDARDYLDGVLRGEIDSFLVAQLATDCSGAVSYLHFSALIQWVADERGITYAECVSRVMIAKPAVPVGAKLQKKKAKSKSPKRSNSLRRSSSRRSSSRRSSRR